MAGSTGAAVGQTTVNGVGASIQNFGYLQPLVNTVLADVVLENFFHDWIAGVLACNPTLVRPAYQGFGSPNIPTAGTWWVAFRFEDVDSDVSPAIVHSFVTAGSPPVEIGQDELRRTETFDVLLSFYDQGQGGQARTQARLMRDGTAIEQNRYPLFLAGMGLVSASQLVIVPAVVSERWLYRCDLRIRVNYMVVRDYPVLSFLTAPGQVATNDGLTVNVIPVP